MSNPDSNESEESCDVVVPSESREPLREEEREEMSRGGSRAELILIDMSDTVGREGQRNRDAAVSKHTLSRRTHMLVKTYRV